jgi:hypothetical protein
MTFRLDTAFQVSFHPTNSSLAAIAWMASDNLIIYNLASNNFDLMVS